LLLPLVIAGLGLFSVGLGLFFAPLVVFFKDFGTLLPYIVRIWMYITRSCSPSPRCRTRSARCSSRTRCTPSSRAEEIFSGQMVSFGYVVAGLAWVVVSLTVGSVFFLLRERDYAVRL
jgi:teichoic acid transport system permease protein